MAVVTLTLTSIVTAQPFQFIPEPYHPAATEAAQRKMSNYTGFKFTISQAAVCVRVDSMLRMRMPLTVSDSPVSIQPSDATPNGNLKQNQGKHEAAWT